MRIVFCLIVLSMLIAHPGTSTANPVSMIILSNAILMTTSSQQNTEQNQKILSSQQKQNSAPPAFSINAEQRAVKEATIKEFNEAVKQTRQDLRIKWRELQFHIYSKTPDEKRITTLVSEIIGLRGIIFKAKVKMQLKLIKTGIPTGQLPPPDELANHQL